MSAEAGPRGGLGMGDRTSEVLAVLWSGGEIEMWELGTRIGPGKGKIVRPELVWRGSVEQGEDNGSGRKVEWREISVSKSDHNGAAGWRIGVLGYEMSAEADVLGVLDVAVTASGDGGDAKVVRTEEQKLRLDGSGWRFVRVTEGAIGALAVHDKKGNIFEREFSRLVCSRWISAFHKADLRHCLRIVSSLRIRQPDTQPCRRPRHPM